MEASPVRQRHLLRWFLLPVTCLVAGEALSTVHHNDPEPHGLSLAGVVLHDQKGATFPLAGLHGQPVVLNFWATWCPPCRAELPDLSRFAATHQCVRVLGISNEPPSRVADFTRSRPLAYPVLFDDDELASRLDVSVLPTTVILDRNGAVVRRIEGMTSADELDRALAPLLAGGSC